MGKPIEDRPRRHYLTKADSITIFFALSQIPIALQDLESPCILPYISLQKRQTTS